MQSGSFTSNLYYNIDEFGFKVLRLPGIKSLGISYTRTFIVGFVVILLIMLLVIGIIVTSTTTSGLRNPGANRSNVQSSDYSGNLIVSDNTFSEAKLDESIKGF
jgi:hypothetical protein